MKTKTRALALTALSVAGAVVVLYMGTFLPTMRLSMAAVAALFVAVCVMEGGLRYGIFCFAATAILGLLIVPDRSLALLYLTFFGAYPLVKSIAERQKSNVIAWVVKLAVFLVVLTLYMTLLRALILDGILDEGWALPVVYGGGLIVFIVYDIGMSKLIGFYLARIHKHRETR